MTVEDSGWDGASPSDTGRRVRRRERAAELRTTDETGVPPALREPPEASERSRSPAPLSGDFDYEDVGPTEIQDEQASSGEHSLDDAPAYEPLADGEVLSSRYRIESILGRGATGLVYDATDLQKNRRVALKVLFPHVAVQPTAVRRLFREANIAATVRHPNVVEVYEGGRDGDTYFLAMELLEGRSLSEHLEENGPLPFDTVYELFDQVLSGIAAVHDEGVVHRDIKPDNIYLCMRRDDPLALGVPKVLDFGISKLKEHTAHTKLTEMGTVMGTPYYMAPEQLADTSSVGVRADVYSLGVLLYESVTGKLPYDGDSVVEIFTAASEGKFEPVTALRPDCPPPLAALIERAMDPDEEQRFRNVHAMRDALAQVRMGFSESAWTEQSEQWHRDDHAATRHDDTEAQPLPVERTKAMAAGYVPGAHEPTPLTSPTVELQRPEPSGLEPTRLILYLALAAAGGGIFVAVVAVILYFVFG